MSARAGCSLRSARLETPWRFAFRMPDRASLLVLSTLLSVGFVQSAEACSCIGVGPACQGV